MGIQIAFESVEQGLMSNTFKFNRSHPNFFDGTLSKSFYKIGLMKIWTFYCVLFVWKFNKYEEVCFL